MTATTFQDIREALITSGYSTLDKQAKALGVHRSTAWTIIKNKHKLGRLSAKTTSRILENPQTPPLVRAAVLQYLNEKAESPLENQPHHSQPASDRTRLRDDVSRTFSVSARLGNVEIGVPKMPDQRSLPREVIPTCTECRSPMVLKRLVAGKVYLYVGKFECDRCGWTVAKPIELAFIASPSLAGN